MSPSTCLCFVLGCLLATAMVASEAVDSSSGRGLLQSAAELAEAERRDDALEAHAIQQAALSREQEAMLRFGTEDAVVVVRKFNKSNRKKQVALFTDLWENAKGIAVVKALGMLINLRPRKTEEYYGIVSDSMQEAEDSGYTFKVSEALYNAMAVTDPENDHYHLLDALLYRMAKKNKEEKGSGCQYIKFLFSDAEIWALDDGRAQQFFRGFDNKDYVSLVECFLPECKGSAAKCCGSGRALSTGMCQCKVINKKKGTVQCDHNLFWTAPRTIWLCSKPSCDPYEKCLCAAPGKKSAKKGKKAKGRKKSKKDEKNEPEEEVEEEEEELKKKNKKQKKNKKPREEEEEEAEEVEAKPKKKKNKKGRRGSQVAEKPKQKKTTSQVPEIIEEPAPGRKKKAKGNKKKRQSTKGRSGSRST